MARASSGGSTRARTTRDGGQTKRRCVDDERLFARRPSRAAPGQPRCAPPARRHGLDYHRPLLLDSPDARQALLAWFDAASGARAMPWRKPWLDPRRASPAALERRAYEVWISEVMLQQTRVAVVGGYWARWMARWPTVHDLARAARDDVVAAWRGLGYYSRAARILDAARLVVADPEMRGLLPAAAADLEARVPGVGRYTAGAISAIVFGRPAPMVDGNVVRVLSRQLGIYANAKADRTVVDVLWAAADALVKAVAAHDADEESASGQDREFLSDRPGRWGQALMDLGSTVCTPKPKCSSCPITSTCRVYAEGIALAESNVAAEPIDMEDLCALCAPFDEAVGGGQGADADRRRGSNPGPLPGGGKAEGRQTRPSQRLSLAEFAFTGSGGGSEAAPKRTSSRDAAVHVAIEYARRFPLKSAAKAVRQEETIVCAIRRRDGCYLIQRRPRTGLLAGLWELPSCAVGGPAVTTARQRLQLASSFASTLVTTGHGHGLKHVGELGSVPWLFSHLKLTMHVHLFVAHSDDCKAASEQASQPRRWSDSVDAESMGTGMHKCWELVRDAQASGS